LNRVVQWGLVWVFTPIVLCGQKQVTHQSLYWARYFQTIQWTPRWFSQLEIDRRQFLERSRLHHFILHAHLHYQLSPRWDVAQGFSYSLQYPQDPAALVHLAVPERRLFTEMNRNTAGSSRLQWNIRLRVDQRWIHRANELALLPGYQYTMRFRFRLQAIYSLQAADAKRFTRIKFFNEFMLNVGKEIVYNHFDQNRLYLGLETSLHKNFSMEAGFLHWYQHRAKPNQFFDRDIFRLTLYHRINVFTS
jgi:hypothetical protein